jgi:2-methylaconitate isomerase
MDTKTVAEPEQIAIPATWMRGGTSNALFFLARDLPPAGSQRDRVIKRAMGSPHVMQIDGMGGARPNTSKVAIIAETDREDADIEYTFAQVGIADDFIDYRAACGNISAAVGPYAILKGLVTPEEPVTRIRIFHTNMGEVLLQDVPVSSGAPKVSGDFVNGGVAGTGAPIATDFSRSVGRRTGTLLPTGAVRDRIKLIDGRTVSATLVDAGNPAAYVLAQELGATGNELPDALMSDPRLMAAIAEIKEQATKLMGLQGTFNVRCGLVSAPSTYTGSHGQPIVAESMDLCGRFFELAHCAPNYPGTASVSTGAAARLPGSVVYDVLPASAHSRATVRIGHPMGIMDVVASAESSSDPAGVKMTRLEFSRTARALMDGVVFVPRVDVEQ